jgi:hypothetical protein
MRSICTSIVATLLLAGTSFADTFHVPAEYATIQSALVAAAAAGGSAHTIQLAPGTYYEHSITISGEFEVLTITGWDHDTGSGAATIDAQSLGPVFIVQETMVDFTNITLLGLTITGGYSAYGGGVIAEGADQLLLLGCTITGNHADWGGGGIYGWESNIAVNYSMVSGNTTFGQGGGAYVDSMIEGKSLLVWGSTFQNNTADAGGAIFSYGEPDEFWLTVTLRDAEICGNSFPQLQGHVYINDLDEEHVTKILVECSPEAHSCCTSSGCIELSEVDCLALNGTWLGGDESCDDCPAACAGDTDSNGVVDIEDLLNMIGNWGPCS